LTAEL
jgi:histone-lysine N-methyltransferase SETD3